MVKKTLLWVLALGLTITAPLAHGEETAKIKERPKGLGLAMGLYSTYFDMTGSERFRHINRLEENRTSPPARWPSVMMPFAGGPTVISSDSLWREWPS